MMRNTEKTIEKGNKLIRANMKRDLDSSELFELMELSKSQAVAGSDAIFWAISNAFVYGVAVGNKLAHDKAKEVKVCG